MARGVDPRSVEQALIAYYDQEADDRAGRHLGSNRVEARDRFLRLLGEHSGPLLEVGPGAGRDSMAFASAGLRPVGVDLSHTQLHHARMVGLAPVVGTVRQLPFAAATFGALWTMSTLMHVPDSGIEPAVSELGRVMLPGAVAAIGVWGGPDVEDLGDKPDRYDPPRLFSRRSDERWRSLLQTIGTIEVFENWHPDNDDFWYQFAIVRRG